ncbi:MAG TPA: CDP-archaeol synthase [Pseudomonadales bacterium]
MTLSPILALQLLVLMSVANGAPVVATRLLGSRWGWPLDGGLVIWDGRRLFGTSKTVRGIVVAIVGTTVAAGMMGLGWQLGLVFGVASMLGDLVSSFTKRRLGIESSGQAIGLDQIPESLFPLLACGRTLGLDAAAIALLVTLFVIGQIVVSPVMYALGIRRRPY